MRKLSDAEIKTRAESLKKRHRSEWCRLVYEASVGRSMREVATLIDRPVEWVREHLLRHQVEDSAGGDVRPADTKPGRLIATRNEVREVMKKFAPKTPNEDYVAEYEAEGHTPEVAKCLATAYEAGENAIEAGVIKETRTKENERASQIILPKGTDWIMRLRRACADVKAAAGLLDRANIADLKRAATRKQVASAHAAWIEQIERLENFHPTFEQEVAEYET